MVRRKLLLILTSCAMGLGIGLASAVTATSAETSCSLVDLAFDTCFGAAQTHGGESKEDSVDVWAIAGGGDTGTRDDPDETTGGSDDGPGADRNAGDSGGSAEQPLVVGCADGSACEITLPPVAATDAPRQVVMADLVNFRPAAPVASMEPDGWLIVGLDTNFIATAAPHVLSGELLGSPAEVRFIPDRYHWSYGDGTSATTTSPGLTWTELGLPEFSATATSRVYHSGGVYTIGLEASYSAEYRFAGFGWQSITGTVASAGNELVAVAAHAKTVLVQRDCIVDPSGPGC